MKIVEKPWGHEEILILTDKYALKRLYIKKECRISLQYHKVKDEAMLVESGTGIIELENAEKKLIEQINPKDTVHILPGTIHRIKAITDMVMIEVSTPELTDVVRLEDDYRRVTKDYVEEAAELLRPF